MTLPLKSTSRPGRRNARIITIAQAEHHNQGEAWSRQDRKQEVLGAGGQPPASPLRLVTRVCPAGRVGGVGRGERALPKNLT